MNEREINRDAYYGKLTAFDTRDRLLTVQCDEMPSGQPGHRLGADVEISFPREASKESLETIETEMSDTQDDAPINDLTKAEIEIISLGLIHAYEFELENISGQWFRLSPIDAEEKRFSALVSSRRTIREVFRAAKEIREAIDEL